MNRPQGSNADEWHLFISENKDALPFVAVQIAEAIEALERKVYVPGQWRCPKCEFRLTQSNLYAATGTVGPRDEPGDECPNCNSPLWRVSAMDDRNEAYKCANDTYDRVENATKEAERYQKIAGEQGTAIIRLRLALTVARAWGIHSKAYSATVSYELGKWIDGGMQEPLPFFDNAFFNDWAIENGLTKINGNGTGPMTTKSELAALEKIFAREIEGHLPLQSKAKIFAKLAEQGLVEPMVKEFRDRFGVMRIEGWQLSHAGRLLYCLSCDDTLTATDGTKR